MSRSVVQMTIEDALHISEEQREAIIEGYPKHEIDARVKGIPAMGSGRCYPIAEEEISIDPFKIPPHWPRIIGIDFGWAHPTAAVMLAHDRDTDILYMTNEYRKTETLIAVNAEAIKSWGKYPVAWPADVGARDKTTGKTFKQIFKEYGLNMAGEHAQFADGGVSVNAGIELILERFHEGKMKIFSNCRMIFNEIQLYHREEGIINKRYDDLLDAMRYAVMMKRFAKTSVKSKPLNYSAIKVV